MRILKVILLQILISFSGFGQDYKDIEFDNKIFSFKDSIKNDLSFEQTVNIINHYCSTETQKIFLIAGWIYNNIDFDLNKFYTGGVVNDYKKVFSLRKGICGDYSSIFSAFCDKLKITNEIIEGYVPEYDSDNKIYYETNHAWNIVKVGSNWYHCDLLGFSGFLKKDSNGGFKFVKKSNTKSLLTQDLSFLTMHIPADPIWQLTNYPIPLDTLLKYGEYTKIDSSVTYVNFENEIRDYVKLTNDKKPLAYADHAYKYNKNNSNIIVINYYNAAVDLINNWNRDKKKLILARKYLEKAKKHIQSAKNGAEVLKLEIEKSMKIINKYVP